MTLKNILFATTIAALSVGGLAYAQQATTTAPTPEIVQDASQPDQPMNGDRGERSERGERGDRDDRRGCDRDGHRGHGHDHDDDDRRDDDGDDEMNTAPATPAPSE